MLGKQRTGLDRRSSDTVNGRAHGAAPGHLMAHAALQRMRHVLPPTAPKALSLLAWRRTGLPVRPLQLATIPAMSNNSPQSYRLIRQVSGYRSFYQCAYPGGPFEFAVSARSFRIRSEGTWNDQMPEAYLRVGRK